MRILHLNHEKGWRGGERQTLLTALEQRQQGVDACIGCRRGSSLEQMAQAAEVPTLSLAPNALAALAVLMRRIPAFDLVHCHTGRAHSLALLAMLPRPKPTVVSRRVDFVPRRSWFNRWKFARVSKVVCVSRWIAKLLVDWGLAPDKVAVIYEAVPGDGYLPRPECRRQLAEKTGLRLDQPVVGNIAALVGHKDHATLLRAARVVVDRRPDTAFVIVGDGPLRERLLRQRDELGLTASVHFTGFIPQAERLLAGFDVFAMSSCMEGLGTIVLDAGLAGVPVAATAGGGLPEIVLNDQTGLLAPVGDAAALGAALLRLIEDPGLAGRLAQAARRRLETEFTVTAMAQSYVHIYEALLAKGAYPHKAGQSSPDVRLD